MAVLCDRHQSVSAWAVISGPLSQRMCAGAPRWATRCSKTATGLISGDAARELHHECLACELVDDVQQLQHVAVGGLIELKVKRPHVVGVEFPRFRGHLTAEPSARSGRMCPDAQDTAVFEGVQV